MQPLISVFWNREERRLRAFWRVAFEMLTAAMLIAVLLSMVDWGKGPTAFAARQSGIMACLLLVALVAARMVDRRFLRELGLKFNGRWFVDLLGGFTVGVLMVAIVFGIFYQQGWLTIAPSSLAWPKLLRLQAGWIVTMVLVAIAEEVMFRGYQLKNLSEGLSGVKAPFGIAIAVLVGSVAFGAVHGANPNADIIATISILFAGMMFCIGRICTGSLAAPIGLHFSWNYGIAAVLGLPVSGLVIPGSWFETTTEKNTWTGGDFGPEASPIVILCMAVGTLAFVFWPRSQRGVSENVAQLNTFVPRDGSSIAQSAPDQLTAMDDE